MQAVLSLVQYSEHHPAPDLLRKFAHLLNLLTIA